MRDILKQLNSECGASGSMVITPDGIMVAAVMSNEYEEDSMAAFISSLLLTLNRSLTRFGVSGGMSSCTMSATLSRIQFFNMQNSYLVVVNPPGLKQPEKTGAIESAVKKIMNRRFA